jgi:hypothetical protein
LPAPRKRYGGRGRSVAVGVPMIRYCCVFGAAASVFHLLADQNWEDQLRGVECTN